MKSLSLNQETLIFCATEVAKVIVAAVYDCLESGMSLHMFVVVEPAASAVHYVSAATAGLKQNVQDSQLQIVTGA